MKTIFCNRTYKGEMLDFLCSIIPEGFNLTSAIVGSSREECLEKIRDADYLFATHELHVDAELLNAAPKLKMVQRLGVGMDSVNLEAIKNRGIPLYINRGVNSRSVAELTVLLIMALARKLLMLDTTMRANEWNRDYPSRRELYGQTVGLIGFGNIASLVAERIIPFGVKILYHDIYRLSPEKEKKYNATYCEVDELLKESDIVSMHCMMDDKNCGMMNKEAFAKMKKGALLVNTSRGGLVNEKDLAEAILSGKLGGAALDVFNVEPLPQDSILRGLPNVILTPHAGSGTLESAKRMLSEGINNIIKFDAGDLDAIADRRIV